MSALFSRVIRDDAKPLNLGQEILRLQAFDLVQGVVIQRGKEVIESNAVLADSKIDAMAAAIDEMRAGYVDVGREANYWLFGFQAGQIMVVSRGECAIWVLLKRGTQELEMIQAQMKEFLRIQFDLIQEDPGSSVVIEPVQPVEPVHLVEVGQDKIDWEAFVHLLTGLLARVVSQTQAEKIVERELVSQGFGLKEPALKTDYPKLGKKVLSAVPNRSRRNSLLSEFEELVTAL